MSETSSGELYSILGAKPDATYKELKACYQRAILQCHPDKLPLSVSEEDQSAAKEQFSKVDMAWRTLCNDTSRKAYDFSQTGKAETFLITLLPTCLIRQAVINL